MSISIKGSLEIVSWKQVRKNVASVNPILAKLIDELSPNDKHLLAKVRYPYGGYVMKKSKLMLPNHRSEIVPIGDDSLGKKINDNFSYNLCSNPAGIVLKNAFEIFLPLEDRTIPLSGIIKPGTAFGAWRVLNPGHSEQPAFIWDMTAGSRSVFMLPKITEGLKHKKLEKNFGINAGLPRTLMHHWEIFRELANSPYTAQEPWGAEILYFSEHWFKHLEDHAWSEFYQYFYQAGWSGSEFWRNQPVWSLIFSLILKEYESRPSAYIMDTARHLLNVGVGAVPGLGPVQNTLAGPFDLIQQIYESVYRIKQYPPIIIQPQLFDMRSPESDKVYYALQFPNAIEFKPSPRARTNIISDTHEIRSLMKRYQRELLSNKFNIDNTSLKDLFLYTHYDYFHSAVELHQGMRDAQEMAADINLRTTLDGKVHENFPSFCLFGKGCIRLSHKANHD